MLRPQDLCTYNPQQFLGEKNWETCYPYLSFDHQPLLLLETSQLPLLTKPAKLS